MYCKPKLSNDQIKKIIGYTCGAMAGRPTERNAPPFGEKLAQIRKSKGLSQEELAKQLSTTRANIAYYERKATNPTLDLIQRCADILNVPITDLLENHAISTKKPGPKSKLEYQFEKITSLPKSRQQFFSKLLDELLASDSKSAS